MDEQYVEPEEVYTPKVSEKARTAIYYVGLAVAALTFVVSGSAAVVMEDPTAVVTISGLTGTAFAGIAAGTGVAYRPTR